MTMKPGRVGGLCWRGSRRVVTTLLLLLASALVLAQPVEWTAAERARIAAHGPWPPPALSSRDPGNRVSGNAAAIAFGQRLFFDGRLSAPRTISCAFCHQPERAWTDGRATTQALAPGDRNTQPLFNLRLQRWYGWGGSSDSLWMASLRAIVEPREMGASVAHVAREVRRRPDLACDYQRSFGRAPPDDDDLVAIDVVKALAAFQETLTTGRTPFDAFRDALLADDRAALARYPQAAQRGLRLFIGRANCALCHSGPNFSNGEFHDTGVPFFVRVGEVDPGRHAGLRAVQASPYNLLGRFNDDASRANAIATRHARLEHRNWGEWRTPSLREVTSTAPYMHNGSLATLREVVDHYATLSEERLHADGERLLRALDLDPAERDDLVAFLQTLSSTRPPAPHTPPPAPAPANARCD
jgi:cytochrome c peroxidase